VTVDIGLTHVALPVHDVDRTVDFYARFAAMVEVHRRTDPATGARVVWVGDRTRPFVIVFIEQAPETRLGGWSHLGVACRDRADVDRLLGEARDDGFETMGPLDDGPPVGYWGIIVDPDGHNLELSYGQEVGAAVGAGPAGDAAAGDADDATGDGPASGA